jgi:large subunit ribosomal protein L15
MTGMPRPRKRSRKMRGSWTHGYGEKKRHRGKGTHGGRGSGGMHKHKWSYTVKYAPDHYGYKGFRPPAAAPRENVINLDDAEKLAKKLGKKELNLTEMGYTKLLARGDVASALHVTVAKASARAKQAIEEAGGKLILEQEPKAEEKETEK